MDSLEQFGEHLAWVGQLKVPLSSCVKPGTDLSQADRFTGRGPGFKARFYRG
jgi:hypothetical protein